MRNIYPQILPDSLSELPDLLKGKVADAAEMFLAANRDYDGALACEMAAHLLDEEMTSEDTPYSFDERMAILRNAHQLDDWAALASSAGVEMPHPPCGDWSVEAGRAAFAVGDDFEPYGGGVPLAGEYAADPVVREKLGFVINLATSYAQRDKSNYWRFMNEAAHCARYLARVYREQLEAEEAASSEEACMAEGA